MEEQKNELLMPKTDELVLSSSPHIQTAEHVPSIMLKVIIALFPAVMAAVYFFGVRALIVMVATMLFCVGAEALWCKIAQKPVWGTIKDGSAALTGLLLAMNLSAGVPLWGCLIGAFLAIWLGKQVFGGLGQNPFNPALVARVGLLIALPAAMTTWVPTDRMNAADSGSYSQVCYTSENWKQVNSNEPSNCKRLDDVTCATPLGLAGLTEKKLGRSASAVNNFKAIDNPTAWKQYFLGNKGGCLGEVSGVALLIGFVLLLCWRLIKWRIPVAYIATVAVFTGIVHAIAPGVTPGPIFHILTGGLLLGAIFMATDMVTSPVTAKGAILFGVGCGILTSVIRIWGNYPEGVSFSILFMNALVPLLDRATSSRPFGYVVRKKVQVNK